MTTGICRRPPGWGEIGGQHRTHKATKHSTSLNRAERKVKYIPLSDLGAFHVNARHWQWASCRCRLMRPRPIAVPVVALTPNLK